VLTIFCIAAGAMTRGKLLGMPNKVVEISCAEISTRTLGRRRILRNAAMLSSSVYSSSAPEA